MAKESPSTKNFFKAIHDLDLLDLVDSKNPYFASRPSAISKKPLDSRAVINRVNTLVTAFRGDDLKKKVKSGTEEQYGRIAELLNRVVAAIDDSKKQKVAKTQAKLSKVRNATTQVKL
ncbi:hypothetical protein RvY_01847 [Ramazzottius varieornatus]|uniref:Uncharacterized protein n=1 Tax=Ramazzottius varieornatus TaxID=947166 RepID=A0A1D1UIK9_RAMVA|nr:hypothetical protein RvY_01847 [Ramazzottius varieornatus]